MHRLLRALAFASSGLMILVTAAAAQDINATPHYGTINLNGGFMPDPHVVEVTAGGSVSVDVGGCSYGKVASAPDLDLNYAGRGQHTLYITVRSDADVTLLVNTPDTSWRCDDDSLSGTNPLLVIPQAASGLYNIWIGTYGDAPMTPATLRISEIDPR